MVPSGVFSQDGMTAGWWLRVSERGSLVWLFCDVVLSWSRMHARSFVKLLAFFGLSSYEATVTYDRVRLHDYTMIMDMPR